MATLSTTLNNPTIPSAATPTTSLLVPGPVDYYFVFDGVGSTYTDYTTEANEDTINDTPLLPAVLTVGPSGIHYVGMDSLFVAILYEVGTAAAGTFASIFEYSKSPGWKTLSEYFGMETDIDGFRVAERHVLALLPPTDFDKVTVDGQSAYWVRFRNTNTGAGYSQPLGNRIRVYPPAFVPGGQMHVQII